MLWELMSFVTKADFSRMVLTCAILSTAFYALTAIVYYEGSFACYLVLRPELSWGWFFGGGEEGAWARANPSLAPPWWMREQFIRLASCDWEYGHPWWVTAYTLGILATPLFWIVWLLAAFKHRLKPVIG